METLDQVGRNESVHPHEQVGAHHGSPIALLETALEPPSSTSHGTASQPGLRVHSLDYLRGIFALGVMFCHYLSINGIRGSWLVNQSMARIGSYSVCGFYILSGMSLGLVYASRTMNRDFLAEFAIKRVCRIVPLFWLAITLNVWLNAIPALLSGGQPVWHEARRLLLNYSLLFAWVNPADSIPMGGWSIGVEMVFYAFFPLILVLARHAMQTAVLVVCLAVAPAAVFAFGLLRPAADFSGQWGLYVNPLNHLFLFVIGIVLAVRRPAFPVRRKLLAYALPGLVVAFLVFPAGGNIYGAPELLVGDCGAGLYI
ncbi:MAG: acyltransferase [Verrucomicrobiota bacterium]